tara:strand:- start:25 stop:483 length:459 start_codon:yes stop_codon:yes gene_type:complete
MFNYSICEDNKFILKQLKYVPYIYRSSLSDDEIRSELNIAMVNCCKGFDPKKGSIFPYVQRAFFNGMKNLFRDKSFYSQSEVSLSEAYSVTYTEEEPEHLELIVYLSSLPNELLVDLTEFALGKKNKEEIVSNPSFFKLDVSRVIEKLDFLL